jgi:hypothetical protein
LFDNSCWLRYARFVRKSDNEGELREALAHRGRRPRARARPCVGRLDLAGRRANPPCFHARRRSVRGRPAPRPRRRSSRRHGRARPGGRNRLVRRLGARRRTRADDPDRGRVRGHAAPARGRLGRSRRRGGRRRAGGQRGRERGLGHPGAARPSRRSPRGGARGLRRSAALVARAHRARAGAGSGAAAGARPGSDVCPCAGRSRLRPRAGPRSGTGGSTEHRAGVGACGASARPRYGRAPGGPSPGPPSLGRSAEVAAGTVFRASTAPRSRRSAEPSASGRACPARPTSGPADPARALGAPRCRGARSRRTIGCGSRLVAATGRRSARRRREAHTDRADRAGSAGARGDGAARQAGPGRADGRP